MIEGFKSFTKNAASMLSGSGLEKVAAGALFRHSLNLARKALPGFKYNKPGRIGSPGKVGDLKNQVQAHLKSSYTNPKGGSSVDDSHIMKKIFAPRGVDGKRIDITGLTGMKDSSFKVPKTTTRPITGVKQVNTNQLVGNRFGRQARYDDAVEAFAGSNRKGVVSAAEGRIKQQLSGRHWARMKNAKEGDMFIPSSRMVPSAPNHTGVPSSKTLIDGVRHSQPQKNLFFRGTNSATPRAAQIKPGQKGVFVSRHPSVAYDYAMHGAQLGKRSSGGAGGVGNISVVRPARGVKRRGEGPHFGPRNPQQYQDARPLFAEAQKGKHNPKVQGNVITDSPTYEELMNFPKGDASRFMVGNYRLVPALQGVRPGYAIQRISGPPANKLFAKGPQKTVVERGRRVPLPEGHDPSKPTFSWARPDTPGW